MNHYQHLVDDVPVWASLDPASVQHHIAQGTNFVHRAPAEDETEGNDIAQAEPGKTLVAA